MHKVPKAHTRQNIEELVARLTNACNAHGGTHAEKVKAFATDHAELLHSYPMLYRTICRGTLRPDVLKNLLDARDQMDRGVDKKTALDGLIVKAVDEVNSLKSGKIAEPKTDTDTTKLAESI